MATTLGLASIVLAIASGVLACVALMSPLTYRLVTAPEAVADTPLEEAGDIDLRRNGEQFRIGILAAVLAVAAALMQVLASGWLL